MSVEGTAQEAADSGRQAAVQAHDSAWTDRVARTGLVAYGVVHLALAWLALQLAFGDHFHSADTTGAMLELAQQPFGRVAVWLVAVGLFLLALWQLLEAAVGHRDETQDRARLLARGLSAAKVVLYAALGASALKVAVGAAHRSGDSQTRSLTARLLDLPAGPALVVLVGLVVVGVGVGLLHRGWTEGFAGHLSTEGRLGTSGAAFLVLGRIGYLAKGAVLLAVGALIGVAGLTHDPHRSGGLDQALQTLLRQPFGPVLLVLVALGIAAFGVFCFAHARHLRRS